MFRDLKKALVVFFLSAVFFSQNAYATNKVYSPIVEQGELEIETRGSYDFDSQEDKDGAQKQKYAVGYGVTDRWFTEVYGEIEKEAEAEAEEGEEAEGSEFEWESVEWENRLQLFEQGRYWLDAGLYFAYEWATRDEGSDKMEGKLLLEKEFGPVSHTLNLVLEKQTGGGPTESLEGGLAWASRYRFAPWLEPGIEYYAEFGEFKERHSWDEQEHLAGPVLSGKILDHLKYEIGYLFGLSEEAPDGRLKWTLELEWRF